MVKGYYEDWQEACMHSAGKKAVARWRREKDRRGNLVKTEIVKKLNEDPMIVYEHTAIPIRKASASECDRVTHWKAA